MTPWWSLVLACATSAPSENQEPEEAVSTPSPYVVDEVEDDETPYDQDAVEAALNEAISAALALNASPVLDGYEAVMAGATDDCPNYYSDGGNVYWYDYCTSDLGSTFNGYVFYYAYDDYDDGSGLVYNGRQLYAEAVVQTADGYAFEGGGYATQLFGVGNDGSNDYQIYYSDVGGAFSWDGAGVQDTWLGEGVRAETGYWITEYPAYGMNAISLWGGVTGLPGTYDTVSFTDVVYGNDTIGWPCSGEVAGTISVRAEDGTWFDVVFDPDGTSWTADEATCDGCGSVWHRGELVGQACPDPDPLVSWEGAPW